MTHEEMEALIKAHDRIIFELIKAVEQVCITNNKIVNAVDIIAKYIGLHQEMTAKVEETKH